MPTYAYLYPPELLYSRDNPDTIPDKDLIFSNADKNNTSIFSGYEIYYKIYDPLDDSPGASSTLYLTEKTRIVNSSGTGKTELDSLKFSRLYTADSASVSTYSHSESKPAFPIDSALLDQAFNIRLKFLQNQSSGSSFYGEPWNTSISFSEIPYLYRRVENSSTLTTSNKFFDTADFDINDSDMPASINSDSYNSLANKNGDYYLYISFFILSYGRDSANPTTSIYSDPLYLGTLKFDSELTVN